MCKRIEATVLRQTRERTKSSRRQEVCQKILWFYARRLRNLSEAALLYAGNQHVTQSTATIQHHEEHLPPHTKKTNDKRAEDAIFETRGLSRLPQTKQTLCSFNRLCYLSLVFQLKVKWRSARSDAWRFVIIRGGKFFFFLLLLLLSASHISTTLNTAVQEKRGEEAVLSLQQGQSQDWRQWSYSTKV